MSPKEPEKPYAYLIDVEVRRIKGKPYTEVLVPLPQAGIYQLKEGLHQALPGRLYLPNKVVTVNKTQNEPGKTLGVARLDYARHYAPKIKTKDTTSIHEMPHQTELRLSARQLRDFNEQYGRPAIKRFERQKAAELAKTQPGYQLSLFDEIPISITEQETQDELSL